MLTHNIISVYLLIHVVQWDTKCKYWSLQRAVSIIYFGVVVSSRWYLYPEHTETEQTPRFTSH